MKKRLLLLNMLFLLLVACSQIDNMEDKAGTQDGSLSDSITEDETSDKHLPNDGDFVEISEGECSAGWTCMSTSAKIYRNEDCTFGKREDCAYGCNEDDCNPPPVCEPLWGCKGSNERGYQEATCQWVQVKKCEFGCDQGKCQDKPNQTRQTQAPTPVVSNSELELGQSIMIGDNSVSIYLIEAGQVRVKINDFKSDWLSEGGNFTSNGLVFNVKEIYFQPYEGGKKLITYTTG
jgi:hypothetical protein